MITKEDFKNLFGTWQWVINSQTEGLSFEDMLLQPQPGGNSMLWVLGHMVDSMVDLVEVLGGPRPTGFERYQRFSRLSEPVVKEEDGLPKLTQILEDFGKLSDLAQRTLDDQDEQFFTQPGWRGSKGESALFFAFHMSYHSGQLEQLRNLAGRTEKVIE